MGRRQGSPPERTGEGSDRYLKNHKTRPFAATSRWRDRDSNPGHHDFQL